LPAAAVEVALAVGRVALAGADPGRVTAESMMIVHDLFVAINVHAANIDEQTGSIKSLWTPQTKQMQYASSNLMMLRGDGPSSRLSRQTNSTR
jgi:hypothetical protein